MGCAGYFCAWATSVTRNTATQSSSRRLSLGMEVLPPSARVAVLNSRHARSRRTPDRVCRLQDALKLSPLLILGERDFRHPTEAALRTDCELINREVLARLVNSALEQVERFEIGCLCRDKPEDRDLAFRHVPKRLKAAGPLVIVFKQEPTMIESLKYPLGYRVVVFVRIFATASHPLASDTLSTYAVYPGASIEMYRHPAWINPLIMWREIATTSAKNSSMLW